MASYLAGKGGSVSLDGGTTQAAFRSWKASMKAAFLKINDFPSQGFQTGLAGFISAAITLDGAYFAGGTPITVGNILSLKLGFSAALFLTVSAMVTDLTPTVDAEKEETLSVSADSVGTFAAAVT